MSSRFGVLLVMNRHFFIDKMWSLAEQRLDAVE